MTKARTLADNFAADINGITAGTGITGGGTSGTVTITNDMATAINAKGDLVVGTGADAYARLAVASTAGYLLSVDSAEATGLKWAAPASGSTFVGVGLYRTTQQSISSATFTAITFNAEEFDTDAFHDNSTNNSRITIPSGKGGKYLVTGQVCISSANTSGSRALRLYKNGSIYGSNNYAATANYYNGVGQDFAINFAVTVNLVATDYIELYYYQNSGVTITSEEFQNYFTATYLGA